ncbi:MAG: hypothetical protein B7Z15_23815 [Rhizobiales bacterium 32-66-8]|nr:MAG: hypothetical protein B7Z15_23815 [Rhizobiales bacterium 32-66-8]
MRTVEVAIRKNTAKIVISRVQNGRMLRDSTRCQNTTMMESCARSWGIRQGLRMGNASCSRRNEKITNRMQGTAGRLNDTTTSTAPRASITGISKPGSLSHR